MLETLGKLSTSATANLSVTQRVTQAIQHASTSAGVDFSYLLNKASQESSLNPNAKASTSSATGLFQFVEQTWLHTVKTYGEKYGLGGLANRISIDTNGVAHVADAQSKQSILGLRKDPQISADMAAELTNENKATLQDQVGGKIGSTELYLAHFLGAGGATEFLNTMHDNPNAKAADVLPTAAAANSSVFYDKSGQPRSLQQIYNHFAKKFDAPAQGAQPVTMVASAAPISSLSLTSPVASSDITGTSPYAPSAMNGFKTDTSSASLFATMVLAQMNVGDMAGTHAASTAYGDDSQKKKSVISTLAMVG